MRLQELIWWLGIGARMVKTASMRWFGGSDLKRWSDGNSLDEGWDERTKLIASLIRPGSRVLEFGAGRCALESVLPEHCTYMSSDLVRRRPDTIVLDLNSSLWPPLPDHDVAVFSGVMEYVHDIESVAQRLSVMSERVITSYTPVRAAFSGERLTRLADGWVNDLSESQFEDLFATAGYRLEKTLEWKVAASQCMQIIFGFERSECRTETLFQSADKVT